MFWLRNNKKINFRDALLTKVLTVVLLNLSGSILGLELKQVFLGTFWRPLLGHVPNGIKCFFPNFKEKIPNSRNKKKTIIL